MFLLTGISSLFQKKKLPSHLFASKGQPWWGWGGLVGGKVLAIRKMNCDCLCSPHQSILTPLLDAISNLSGWYEGKEDEQGS